MNDRPVQLVGTPDGGLDCVVYDWRSGSFVVDRSYFTRTIPGDFADVDALDTDQFDAVVSQHRIALVASMAERLSAAVDPDADAVIAVLGLDPAVPPFDGLAVEALHGPGIMVVEPRLLWREALDARFGTPSETPGPGSTLVLGYRVASTSCAITAVVADGAPSREAVLLSIVRIS